MSRSILEEAEEIVAGPRAQVYGPPKENLQRIADLWSVYLRKEIKPTDVCALMVLLKVARNAGGSSFHRDTWMDIGGYSRVAQLVGEPNDS